MSEKEKEIVKRKGKGEEKKKKAMTFVINNKAMTFGIKKKKKAKFGKFSRDFFEKKISAKFS
jgi:hypothetical protein